MGSRLPLGLQVMHFFLLPCHFGPFGAVSYLNEGADGALVAGKWAARQIGKGQNEWAIPGRFGPLTRLDPRRRRHPRPLSGTWATQAGQGCGVNRPWKYGREGLPGESRGKCHKGNGILVIVILSPSAWLSPPWRTLKNLSSITQAGFRTRNRADGRILDPSASSG